MTHELQRDAEKRGGEAAKRGGEAAKRGERWEGHRFDGRIAPEEQPLEGAQCGLRVGEQLERDVNSRVLDSRDLTRGAKHGQRNADKDGLVKLLGPQHRRPLRADRGGATAMPPAQL